MASEKLEGAELKKMVKLAKKKDMPFAFCPGKKKENHVVIVDRRKNPKILAKAAKAEGESGPDYSPNGKIAAFSASMGGVDALTEVLHARGVL